MPKDFPFYTFNNYMINFFLFCFYPESQSLIFSICLPSSCSFSFSPLFFNLARLFGHHQILDFTAPLSHSILKLFFKSFNHKTYKSSQVQLFLSFFQRTLKNFLIHEFVKFSEIGLILMIFPPCLLSGSSKI